MATLADVQEFVSRFSFGWWQSTFVVTAPTERTIRIAVRACVQDRDTGVDTTENFAIVLDDSVLEDTRAWREYVFHVLQDDLVKNMVEHEMWNFWRFDGALVRDPHRSTVHDVCAECGKGTVQSVSRRDGTFTCSDAVCGTHMISTVRPTQHPSGAGHGA